ncbi:putative 10.5 kDa protein [red squirrel adenovirus 1]|uniref:Putative 10.5 kDa protein n=1 Tax=red squirrel adenovirus 1 TaxID=2773314 RepID=A0A240FBG7_9ADEN|nr:putative 10.5 kDa protein [red squirrel adenovirus 1]ARE31897.1 putative 10.5 kDa protein [red squirrel adenovirus 1]
MDSKAFFLYFILLTALPLTTGSSSDYDSWPAQIYTLVGHNFTLQGDYMENGTYYWSKFRFTNESRRDQIAKDGNCSIVPQLDDRITSCLQNLTMTNVSKLDSGEYVQRVKTANDSVHRAHYMTYFNVTVFQMKPVLSIVRMSLYSVTVRCDDLENKDSYTYVEVKNLEPEYYFHYTTNHHPYLVELHMGGYVQPPMLWKARCCATRYSITSCGPWRKINHDRVLCNNRAAGRNWCKERGPRSLLKGFNFDKFANERPPDGHCYKHTFVVTTNHTIRICEDKPTLLTNQHNGSWIMHRPLGGTLRVQTPSRNWNIPHPSFNFTGSYYIKPMDSNEIPFYLDVTHELRAVVELIRVYDNRVKVRCGYNGLPTAFITWDIIGQYEKYEKHDNTIVFYPDCWKNWSKWYYKFGIRCHVRDGPWYSTSPWFRGHVTRGGGDCNRLIDNENDD